ncbi:WYL domain-containing protein [Sphingomonas sp. ID1715]|uniref:WYL domain-containing protein n=1 Tax=Sphingomonas sp. ID1715 TaxID=1656898 RepID=UPI00148925C8|nr:WYL domain-containing protein [Sphingomonas sp. ID1715]NNM76169.1 WYL domain-containing protein [Sphingomonas sp. ID1715]
MSLRTAAAPGPETGGEPSEALLRRALRERSRIEARYNKGHVVLEPLLMFREHDALFLVAGTALRDGQPPREPKIGIFRLAGLSELAASEQRFVPPAFEDDIWSKPSRELVARVRSPARPLRP